MNKSTYKEKNFSILISFMLLLLVVIEALWSGNTIVSDNGWSQFVYLFISVYLISRLLITHCHYGSAIVMLSFAIVCAIEIFLSVSQLLGQRVSDNCLFTMTGSFMNPGPLGCFLSVCISLFISYCVKQDKALHFSADPIKKILFYIVLIVAFAACIILPATQSRSAFLALGLSMFLLVITTKKIWKRVKPILKKYWIWIFTAGAIFTVGVYLYKKPSADGRFLIDKVSIKAMSESGINGVGIGKFGGAYGEAQAEYFRKRIESKGIDDLDWTVLKENERLTADCPDNAFNEYLYIGVEAGPIVMLLFIFALLSAIIMSLKNGTIWCYGIISFAAFALFSYPLHVWELQAVFSVLMAASVSEKKSCSVLGPVIKYSSFERITVFVVIVVLASNLFLEHQQNKQYDQAKVAIKKITQLHQLELYDEVVENSDTLFPLFVNNSGFLFAYGQSLNKTEMYEKSDSVLTIGTKHSSDPMFWNVMGNNSLARGEFREAEERYKHAFYMVPNRLYPLYLLAQLYHKECDTIRFLDMADRIERFTPKVENVITERLRSEIRGLKISYTSEIE